MKIAKTLNTMDDAVSQLLTVHEAISKTVESKDGARVAAAMMLPPIDTLINCIEQLMEEQE